MAASSIHNELSLDDSEILFNSFFLSKKMRRKLLDDSYKEYMEKMYKKGIIIKKDDETDFMKTYLDTQTKIISTELAIVKGGISFNIRSVLEKSCLSFEEFSTIFPFISHIQMKNGKMNLVSVVDDKYCQEHHDISISKTRVISHGNIIIEKKWKKVNAIIPLPHLWYDKKNVKMQTGYIFVLETDIDIEGVDFIKTMEPCPTKKPVRGHYVCVDEITGNISTKLKIRVKINGQEYKFSIN